MSSGYEAAFDAGLLCMKVYIVIKLVLSGNLGRMRCSMAALTVRRCV